MKHNYQYGLFFDHGEWFLVYDNEIIARMWDEEMAWKALNRLLRGKNKPFA